MYINEITGKLELRFFLLYILHRTINTQSWKTNVETIWQLIFYQLSGFYWALSSSTERKQIEFCIPSISVINCFASLCIVISLYMRHILIVLPISGIFFLNLLLTRKEKHRYINIFEFILFDYRGQKTIFCNTYTHCIINKIRLNITKYKMDSYELTQRS